jgi:very-short-patch-repair endonuclease
MGSMGASGDRSAGNHMLTGGVEPPRVCQKLRNCGESAFIQEGSVHRHRNPKAVGCTVIAGEEVLAPDHYALIYTEERRRIFVIISKAFGDFVLTKSCAGPDCGCIGCAMLKAKAVVDGIEFPILDFERQEDLGQNLVACRFTREGEAFLFALKREHYKPYGGKISKERLDSIFGAPSALIIIKTEKDGTFTHSYVSPTVDRRVIARGCRAKACPCVGCRIVSMYYASAPGHLTPAVDLSQARASEDGELILPIFEGEEIISKMLIRDPAIRHNFSPNIFDSPLEQMFYELAFLDLHIYPQHVVGKYRLDFAIPNKLIAIELDGHEYHKTKYQRTHDAKRDRWLFGQGWHVLRFTGTEIHQALDKCIDEICALVGVERFSKIQ